MCVFGGRSETLGVEGGRGSLRCHITGLMGKLIFGPSPTPSTWHRFGLRKERFCAGCIATVLAVVQEQTSILGAQQLALHICTPNPRGSKSAPSRCINKTILTWRLFLSACERSGLPRDPLDLVTPKQCVGVSDHSYWPVYSMLPPAHGGCTHTDNDVR